MQPLAGDHVQFLKAGVMEIPDLFVVNKCDEDRLARKSAHELRSALAYAKIGGASPKTGAKKAAPKAKKGPPAPKVAPGQRIAKIVNDARPHESKIRELYLIALAREPNGRETELLLKHLQRRSNDVRAGYEDILWVLVNSEEFLFNH